MAAVAKLVEALDVVGRFDRAIGSVKQRERGASAGELLIVLAQSQLLSVDALVGLHRQRLDVAGGGIVSGAGAGDDGGGVGAPVRAGAAGRGAGGGRGPDRARGGVVAASASDWAGAGGDGGLGFHRRAGLRVQEAGRGLHLRRAELVKLSM